MDHLFYVCSAFIDLVLFLAKNLQHHVDLCYPLEVFRAELLVKFKGFLPVFRKAKSLHLDFCSFLSCNVKMNLNYLQLN